MPKTNTLRRLDDKGHLYYMDYVEDYSDPDVLARLIGRFKGHAGCSCFLTHNLTGDVLSCRNYDLGHRVSADDQSFTGLNIVSHCKPSGAYESIGIVDAVWIDPFNPLFQAGGPELDGFSLDLLEGLPYGCVDGMNECGLCVNLLKVDVKEEALLESSGLGAGFLVRYMLDGCATVDEAIALAFSSKVKPADWAICHVFVTDARGESAILESVDGEVYVIPTDIVTNFLQSDDDGGDCYRDGALREKMVRLVDADGESRYPYGFGHGYHRFAALEAQLGMHEDLTSETYRTVMSEEAALVALRSTVQNPTTVAAGISMTQYSAIYNNTKKTLRVWSFQDYSQGFDFALSQD